MSNNQTIIFLSLTSEFTPSQASFLLETSNGDLFTIPATIPTEDLIKELLDWVKSQSINNHVGDDNYYDYIPDAIEQILQITAKKSHQDFDTAHKAIMEDPTLQAIYANDDEDIFCFSSSYDYYRIIN